MALINLRKEMAGANVTVEKIAQLLGVHRNTVSNKIDGETKFTVDEAFKIHDTYFPDIGIEHLFKESSEPAQKQE